MLLSLPYSHISLICSSLIQRVRKDVYRVAEQEKSALLENANYERLEKEVSVLVVSQEKRKRERGRGIYIYIFVYIYMFRCDRVERKQESHRSAYIFLAQPPLSSIVPTRFANGPAASA